MKKFLRFTNLRFKLLATNIIIIFSLGVLIIAFCRITFSERLLDQFQEKGLYVTEYLAEEVINPILTRDDLALKMLVNDHKESTRDIVYVFVLDKKRRVLAHTFEGGFPADLKKANIVAKGEEFNTKTISIEGKYIYDIAVPVLKGEAGVVHIGFSKGPILEDTNRMVGLVTGIVFAGLILAIISTIIFSAFLTKRVSALMRAVGLIGRGKLTSKIHIKGNDEISELGDAFNRMTEDLKNSRNALMSSKNYTDSIIANMIDALIVIDPKGEIKTVNRATLDLLEYREEELIGRQIGEIFAKETPFNGPELKELIEKGFLSNVEKTYLSKKGMKIPMLFSGSVMRSDDGKIQGIVCVALNITERKRAEEQEKTITEDLRTVVMIADELIACPDLNTLFRRAVELTRDKLGMERCAIFMKDEDYMKGTYGTDRYGRIVDEHAQRFPKDKIWKECLRLLDEGGSKWFAVEEAHLEWDGEKTVQIGRGWVVITPIQSAHKPIGIFVSDAAISHTKLDTVKQDVVAVLCSLLGDIIACKRVEKELEALNAELLKSSKRFQQLALTDSHTGLYSHRYLAEALEAEFHRAKRYVHSLSVVMLDIDYFKSINDVYGHQFGDLVLKQLATELKKMVRRYDIIIRFGGEEFIIIFPGTDRSVALILSQRLIDAVKLHNFGDKEHTLKLRLSGAVASYPEDKIVKAMDLVDIADKILNKAKEDGGDRVYSSLDASTQKPVKQNGTTEKKVEVELLKDKIDKLTKRSNQSLIESITAFAKTIELKDHYTGEHVERTVQYATDIARILNLSREEIDRVKQAAILHDLGKIGISERILLKPSKLTHEEFEKIKKHPQIATDIIRPIHFMHSLIPLVFYHHERWDGRGYPNGLKEEEIPLGARIIALADVYQALISDRPYRKAFSEAKAVEIIKKGSATQFDPKIVETFLKVLEQTEQNQS